MKAQLKKIIQTRKAWLLLPLAMLPFLILLGWALGVGRNSQDTLPNQTQVGLSTMLPEPAFDAKESWDKLSLYELAQQDSERFEEARRNDPYYELVAVNTPANRKDFGKSNDSSQFLLSKFPRKETLINDPIEEDVNSKLEELYTRLNQQPTTTAPIVTPYDLSMPASDPQFTNDVERLERVMESLHGSVQPNPEMQQIESVLDKILDVQHPDRVRERLADTPASSQQEVITHLEMITSNDIISLVTPTIRIDSLSRDSLVTTGVDESLEGMGFYGLDSDFTSSNEMTGDIEAVVHDTQKVREGAIVKLRLLTSAKVNNHTLKAGQFIYGTVSFNNERLKININSIRDDITILQVSLKVFDMDGMEGISIRDTPNQADSKSMAGNSIQNVQLLGMNPSLEAQAASAGVEAVKTLFGKRIKTTTVTVKAGYQVLLKAANQTLL